MKKVSFPLFAALCLSLVGEGFAGGTPEIVTTGTIAHVPVTFDSSRAEDESSRDVLKMMREGLTRIGSEGEVEMAQSDYYRVSNDYKVYIFYLRDGNWSDGTPVIAENFIAAWKGALDPKNPSPYASLFDPILYAKEAREGTASLEQVGFRALDEKTLEIELTEPCPDFLERLATPVFLPIPANEESLPISNGPFILKSQNENELFFIANPSYWNCDEVQFDSIVLEVSDKR